MGATATVVAAVVATGASIAGNAIGARAQENDLTQAQKTQRTYIDLLSGFKDEVYGEASPLRTAISKLLPNLISTATSPTTSAGYQTAMKEGLDLISGNAAVSGDPNSGPAQIAKGKFGANLAAAETDRIMDNLFRLFGGLQGASQAATGTSANLLTGMAAPYGSVADLYAAKGANTAALWSSTGKSVAGLATTIGGQF